MSVGKKLNKKDLLSSNLTTKKGYCTQLMYWRYKSISKNMKRFEYKKVIGFTLQQKRAFEVLEEHGVNVNKFIAHFKKNI